jgi:hypothetical protein
MLLWSMYRRPVEHYEATDFPEAPRIDPIKRVLRIVCYFAAIQSLTLLAVLALLAR